MRQHRAATISLELATETRAEGYGARERDKTTDRVYDCRTGEVMKARPQRWQKFSFTPHGCQESVRAPGPVTDDWVDEAGHCDAIKQVTDEACASDHGPRGDRRTSVGEGKLEKPKGHKRYPGRLICRRHAL